MSLQRHVAWKSVMSYLRRLYVFVVKRPLNGFDCRYVLAPSILGRSLHLWWGSQCSVLDFLLIIFYISFALSFCDEVMLQSSDGEERQTIPSRGWGSWMMRQLNDGTITHVGCARRKRDSGSPNVAINLRPRQRRREKERHGGCCYCCVSFCVEYWSSHLCYLKCSSLQGFFHARPLLLLNRFSSAIWIRCEYQGRFSLLWMSS